MGITSGTIQLANGAIAGTGSGNVTFIAQSGSIVRSCRRRRHHQHHHHRQHFIIALQASATLWRGR